jgi:hypothetical protein
LDVGQCREIGGLRAKNELLTTNANLRQAARASKQKEARRINARKTQRATQPAKADNAGQPEPTQRAQFMRSQNGTHATNEKEKRSAA